MYHLVCAQKVYYYPLLCRPTSWELKETLEREQMPLDDDVIQYVRALIGDNLEDPVSEPIYEEPMPLSLEEEGEIYEDVELPPPSPAAVPVQRRFDPKVRIYCT